MPRNIMDASGVALVVIGPGSIDQARAFTEQTKFKGEVYVEPNHSSYEALQFASGVSTTFTPNAGLEIIQLYTEGYRQDLKLSFEKDTVTGGDWYAKHLVATTVSIFFFYDEIKVSSYVLFLNS
ncbi:thioredoxin-like protein AAED1, chloroplastic [Juglans microcarpa x Juglans regia]|uniref:thioredoxin-like protein AAED1, chloroplastic n=1 Tax=Juglans microcarpa x Juglans regia TaxID=2249226 RepID=UPI001B7E1623|nr:thioredoxin-like protein AAED1, chloroplastic [Juglans microcarpa x Juglans regia]